MFPLRHKFVAVQALRKQRSVKHKARGGFKRDWISVSPWSVGFIAKPGPCFRNDGTSGGYYETSPAEPGE